MLSWRLARSVGYAGVAVLMAGCRAHGPDRMPSDSDRVQMFNIMLPQKIKIEPFTTVKSFNPDEIPDGVLAVIRPLDEFGDPVKAAGLFYFELWTYRDASQDRRGERLAFWESTIATPDDVRLHWTHAQMYEFQLAWTGGTERIQPDKKYLFTATYRTPWNETMQDEYILQFHVPREAIKPAPRTRPAR